MLPVLLIGYWKLYVQSYKKKKSEQYLLIHETRCSVLLYAVHVPPLSHAILLPTSLIHKVNTKLGKHGKSFQIMLLQHVARETSGSDQET